MFDPTAAVMTLANAEHKLADILRARTRHAAEFPASGDDLQMTWRSLGCPAVPNVWDSVNVGKRGSIRILGGLHDSTLAAYAPIR